MIRGLDITVAGAEDDVLAAAAATAREQAVATAFELLSASQREVLSLRFYAGLSVRATADALGIEEGARKGRQFRATRALAAVLEGADV